MQVTHSPLLHFGMFRNKGSHKKCDVEEQQPLISRDGTDSVDIQSGTKGVQEHGSRKAKKHAEELEQKLQELARAQRIADDRQMAENILTKHKSLKGLTITRFSKPGYSGLNYVQRLNEAAYQHIFITILSQGFQTEMARMSRQHHTDLKTVKGTYRTVLETNFKEARDKGKLVSHLNNIMQNASPPMYPGLELWKLPDSLYQENIRPSEKQLSALYNNCYKNAGIGIEKIEEQHQLSLQKAEETIDYAINKLKDWNKATKRIL